MNPKPGEVWGDPNEPASWRFVYSLRSNGVIDYAVFGQLSYITPEEWQAYVTRNNCVNITARLEGK